MSPKVSSTISIFFLTLNMLFFLLATSCDSPSPSCGGSSSCGGGGTSPGGGGGGGGTAGKPPKCPTDALKLGVCADVLGSLLNVTIGAPPKSPCCPLLGGLVDLEAAVCLCTAIKLNLLGINLNIPLSLSLLLNYCGKCVPSGFQCP